MVELFQKSGSLQIQYTVQYTSRQCDLNFY